MLEVWETGCSGREIPRKDGEGGGMQLAARGHGYAGKLLADGATAAYVGRGSHALDAASFRGSRAVSGATRTRAFAPPGGGPSAGADGSAALALFYFEAQVLATGESDEDEGRGARPAGRRARARRAVQERVQASGATRTVVTGPEAQDEGGEEDEAMETDETATSEAPPRTAWGLFQHASTDEEESDLRYYQILARNAGAARGLGRTPAGSAADGAGGVHFAFTLSSRTLQNIRSGYERRRMRRNAERKRHNHRVAVGFSLGQLQMQTNEHTGRNHGDDAHVRVDDEKIPLGHRDLGQCARSIAYDGRTGCVVSNGTEYLQCEKYGAGDVVGCGVLFDTKTFFFTLNGQLVGMVAASDVHHLDFFIDNSEGEDADSSLESMFDWGNEDQYESDSDNAFEEDEDEAMSDGEDTPTESHELYPSMSLHRTGECARAVFSADEFKFDLSNFQKQVVKERQRSLGPETFVLSKSDNDSTMNALVLDYFKHFGYDEAFRAMQATVEDEDSDTIEVNDHQNGNSVMANHTNVSRTIGDVDELDHKSMMLRSEIRHLISNFDTTRAIDKLEHLPPMQPLKTTPRYQRVLIYCRILSVLDVALGKVAGDPSKIDCDTWNSEEAVLFAQSSFAAYLSAERVNGKASEIEAAQAAVWQDLRIREDVSLLMSLLIIKDPNELPADSRARMFLGQRFRELVADELNAVLLTAMASHPHSSLERFIQDLDILRTECLSRGCRAFPESAAQLSGLKKRKEEDDDDDELSSSGSDDSSSTSSHGARRRRLQREDYDDEDEED